MKEVSKGTTHIYEVLENEIRAKFKVRGKIADVRAQLRNPKTGEIMLYITTVEELEIDGKSSPLDGKTQEDLSLDKQETLSLDKQEDTVDVSDSSKVSDSPCDVSGECSTCCNCETKE